MRQLVCVFALLTLLGAVTRGADPEPCVVEQPPSHYSLADVVFECKRVGGWGGQTAITLSGHGTGVRITTSEAGDEQTTKFIVEPKEVFDLLQRCYEDNFFSFLGDYKHAQAADLGVGGNVRVLEENVYDATYKSVTVRIGDYSKSVSFFPGHGSPPAVLNELCKRAEDMASRPVAP